MNRCTTNILEQWADHSRVDRLTESFQIGLGMLKLFLSPSGLSPFWRSVPWAVEHGNRSLCRSQHHEPVPLTAVLQPIHQGRNCRRYLSQSFILNQQYEQCDLVRTWLKSNLSLKYFRGCRANFFLRIPSVFMNNSKHCFHSSSRPSQNIKILS